jgi:acid phosphatase type 7
MAAKKTMRRTAKPSNTAAADSSGYPPCVEHGVWTPVPQAPPGGALLLKFKDVDAEESQAVNQRGVMSFHMAGCTGRYEKHVPETRVAEAMAKQVADPHCHGGEASAVAPSFFFHLGDIVYKDEDKTDALRADQQLLYNDHFYAPYACYPRNIFAIAGNHDGKDSKRPEKSPIQHFLKNFCAETRTFSPDNQTSARLTMVQPYVYWLLRTPLAYLVGLYANDINGGQLDDPASKATPQYDWLVSTLKGIRKAADGRAVLLAVHYPPYSAAVNFHERGDPNLGPTSRPRKLQPLGMILQRAFRESKQYPDAVFSAHAHLYQRITYTCADGRQIPFLIVGCGGHGPIESLSLTCDRKEGVSPKPPCDVVLPPGLVLDDGERAQMAACNDRDYGVLRVTLDRNKKTLMGEFFAAFSEVRDAALPALSDSFALDLEAHRLIT